MTGSTKDHLVSLETLRKACLLPKTTGGGVEGERRETRDAGQCRGEQGEPDLTRMALQTSHQETPPSKKKNCFKISPRKEFSL